MNEALTLPYLIGALRQPPGSFTPGEQPGMAELRALLDDVRNTPADGGYFHIYRCKPKLAGQFALRHVPNAKPTASHLAVPSSTDPKLCSLFASEIEDKLKSPIDSVTAALWDEIGKPVSQGLFSFDTATKEYRALKDDEKKSIVVALA